MKLSLRALCFICFFSWPVIGQDTEYLWPTNASQYMTSSFAESRPGRFHMGIDIKTWGRSGYKAFATRDGFITRMRVSPFGYGRALYLKLDTGETVVYAHLQRFNDTLQQIAEREQEKLQSYRIDKHFVDGALPIRKGELIAYTGETGIGVPHLHFEIRDAYSRPINPLSKDYKIKDTISPVITNVVVSPLEPGAMIESDFRPYQIPLVFRNGKYIADQPIRISGKIGFAVDAYDRANGVTNRYGLYRYRLYLNDHLQFQSQFDRLSYRRNKLFQLTHDYSLAARGAGRLHKLYREKGNVLEIFSSLNSADGAILVPARYVELATEPAAPSQQITSQSEFGSQLDAGEMLPWGRHNFRIVVEDYFGNQSVVEGELRASHPYEILLTDAGQNGAENSFRVKSSDGRPLRNVRVHAAAILPVRSQSIVWQTIDSSFKPSQQHEFGEDFPDASGTLAEDGMVTAGSGDATPLPLPELVIADGDFSLLKITAEDNWGEESIPLFKKGASLPPESAPFELEVQREFWPHALHLTVTASHAMETSPEVTLSSTGRSASMKLVPQSPFEFIGIVPLEQIAADSVRLHVVATSLANSRAEFLETFSCQQVAPGESKTIYSSDGRVEVHFPASALYWPIYPWIEIAPDEITDPRVIGPAYEVRPGDALLKRSATIKIAVLDSTANAKKLGICRWGRDEWRFVDNEIDEVNGMITAGIGSFDKFAVIRDDEAPSVLMTSPTPGDSLTERQPKIVVAVDDEISGFKSEKSIEMYLDGSFVIAEYDPEEKYVFYVPKTPLSPGKHTVMVKAWDRCENTTQREFHFSVR